ncbi:MAG TPA: hypothetical protein VE030_11280 [Burkholderiales bacterium]|nr:hypothetical protein [Burkholderiales bacterium]
MPQNLNSANPQGVMPKQLCRSFQEELRLEALLNQYADGSSDRNALAQNVRHFFRLVPGVNGADWAALWQFYIQHQGPAFYFYNLRETVPPFSYDPSGQNTIGRYTVVFDGQWSDTYNVARTDVALQLREVA